MIPTLPERLINIAWALPSNIYTLTHENIPCSYLQDCKYEAIKRGIPVYEVNLNNYATPTEAFKADETKALVKAITSCEQPTLVIFENVDSLAPLDCNTTFWLRTVITTRFDDNLVCLFTASSDAIKQLFRDNRAAFYLSNSELC